MIKQILIIGYIGICTTALSAGVYPEVQIIEEGSSFQEWPIQDLIYKLQQGRMDLRDLDLEDDLQYSNWTVNLNTSHSFIVIDSFDYLPP